jgi:hypothetical protein
VGVKVVYQVAEKRPFTALSSPPVVASRSKLRDSLLGISGAFVSERF